MTPHWPVTGLRVHGEDLELRWPTPADLEELAGRAVEGIHPPEVMPFFSQWTDGDAQTVARRVLQRHWAAWSRWSPADWTLYLVVVIDGTVAGSVSAGARDFAVTREVVTTSWLSAAFQGRGVGTRARAALLDLVFAGLHAERALSVVPRFNLPSQVVSRKLGFVDDGYQVNSVRGRAVLSDRLRLDRPDWDTGRPRAARIENLVLGPFGLGDDPGGPSTWKAGAVPDAETLSGVRALDAADESGD